MISYSCRICSYKGNRHVYADEVMNNVPHVGLCGDCNPIFDHQHEFKLDNLKYLEQLYDLRTRT